MLFTAGLVAGLLAGWILLRLRVKGGAWIAMAMGLGGAALIAAGVWGRLDSALLIAPSIALPFAALVLSAGCVARGERRWFNWLALAIAASPALFWAVFVIAEIVGPPH